MAKPAPTDPGLADLFLVTEGNGKICSPKPPEIWQSSDLRGSEVL